MINRSSVVYRRYFGVLDLENPGHTIFFKNSFIYCVPFHKSNYIQVVLKKQKEIYCTTNLKTNIGMEFHLSSTVNINDRISMIQVIKPQSYD